MVLECLNLTSNRDIVYRAVNRELNLCVGSRIANNLL